MDPRAPWRPHPPISTGSPDIHKGRNGSSITFYKPHLFPEPEVMTLSLPTVYRRSREGEGFPPSGSLSFPVMEATPPAVRGGWGTGGELCPPRSAPSTLGKGQAAAERCAHRPQALWSLGAREALNPTGILRHRQSGPQHGVERPRSLETTELAGFDT